MGGECLEEDGRRAEVEVDGPRGMVSNEEVEKLLKSAGIMTSVALQLFTESLSINHHNKNLSILFAFLGMILLGFSNALVKN